MNATWTEKEAEAVITYTVTDALDIPVPYTKVTIRPDFATVTTTRDGWKRAVVSGPNVKKDGTTGENRHSVSYWGGARVDQRPAWLVALVDEQLDRVDLGGDPR